MKNIPFSLKKLAVSLAYSHVLATLSAAKTVAVERLENLFSHRFSHMIQQDDNECVTKSEKIEIHELSKSLSC